MAFWKKIFKSKYTGAEIDAAVAKTGELTKVTANPSLAGTESALTGLELGTTKYKVEQPINVVANPTLAGTEAALEGLQVGETKYKVGGGGSDPLDQFVIKFIWGEDDSLTCDKTATEIGTALADGKNVIATTNYGGYYYYTGQSQGVYSWQSDSFTPSPGDNQINFFFDIMRLNTSNEATNESFEGVITATFSS